VNDIDLTRDKDREVRARTAVKTTRHDGVRRSWKRIRVGLLNKDAFRFFVCEELSADNAGVNVGKSVRGVGFARGEGCKLTRQVNRLRREFLASEQCIDGKSASRQLRYRFDRRSKSPVEKVGAWSRRIVVEPLNGAKPVLDRGPDIGRSVGPYARASP
jgi:hypothetical protein